jgi:hypothetical protein
MWIGVALLGDAGINAGSVEAISHDEFLGNADRKGYSVLADGRTTFCNSQVV